MAQASVRGEGLRRDSYCTGEHVLQHLVVDRKIGRNVFGNFAPQQCPLVRLVLDRGLVRQGNALVGNVLRDRRGGLIRDSVIIFIVAGVRVGFAVVVRVGDFPLLLDGSSRARVPSSGRTEICIRNSRATSFLGTSIFGFGTNAHLPTVRSGCGYFAFKLHRFRRREFGQRFESNTSTSQRWRSHKPWSSC